MRSGRDRTFVVVSHTHWDREWLGGFFTEPVEVMQDERVVLSAVATYLFVFAYGVSGRLYLTNKRMIFAPYRFVPGIPAPSRRRPVIATHGEITALGEARHRSWGRWMPMTAPWYVEVGDETHFFNTWPQSRSKWLDTIKNATGIALGGVRVV